MDSDTIWATAHHLTAHEPRAKEATAAPRPSGRFVLRIDPGLHGALRAAARGAGLSLNELCVRRLAAGGVGAGDDGTAAVTRAAQVAGDALLAVVAYGSWARGEAVERSDVDLLVVVERRLCLTRSLYSAWDAEPVRWGDHPVEPHFVHPPDPGGRLSGTWAEVATDGVVLFDRGLAVSRALVLVRRAILDGRLVRREAHGHPYWVGAA